MAAQFKLLREAYLPETLLVWLTSLHFAGGVLSRDYIMQCLEFGSLVAEEGSDILDAFMKSGRMQDLVEILAEASKRLVISSSEPKVGTSTGSSSKRKRYKGWNNELWNVKL